MADTGWIKLHRVMLDGPIIQHAGMLQVWIHCLLRANWEPRKIMFPGCLTPIPVGRGEFVTGRNSLHSQLYPNPDKNSPVAKTVWRWLEALEEMGCVSLRTVSNRCTVVTVLKYGTYQGRDDGQCPADAQPVPATQPVDVPQIPTDRSISDSVIKDEKEAPAAFSRFEGRNPEWRTIECRDGTTVLYERNDIVWEFEFISRWNRLPDVSMHSSNALADIERRALMERFQEHDWDWKAAMKMFPINWPKISLFQFLKKDFVQATLCGDRKIPEFAKPGASKKPTIDVHAGIKEVLAEERAKREKQMSEFEGVFNSCGNDGIGVPEADAW